MLHKVMTTMRAVQDYCMIVGECPTIGELSRATGKPYSTIRRALITAKNSELVDFHEVPYKATGKRQFFITQKGGAWLDGYRSMF